MLLRVELQLSLVVPPPRPVQILLEQLEGTGGLVGGHLVPRGVHRYERQADAAETRFVAGNLQKKKKTRFYDGVGRETKNVYLKYK